jgi:hypothetical protein
MEYVVLFYAFSSGSFPRDSDVVFRFLPGIVG